MSAYRFLAPAIVAALLLTASTACATDLGSLIAGPTDREYLKAKLSFRYVDQPNTTTSTPAVLDNTDISSGMETGPFWTNRSIPGLQGLVRALLREPVRGGGNPHLQNVVASVVKIL